MKFKDGNIKLSLKTLENSIQIDDFDFLLFYIGNFESNKGAHSNLFILRDPSGEEDDKVIKICKSPLNQGKTRSIERFNREIKAFGIAKKANLSNVIEFYKSGETHIDGYDFKYLIMEKAESDLSTYLENKQFNFTINQKLTICKGILNGIKQLHNVGIYHRDIKHDNILFVNGQFKIGDLGLARFRPKDFDADLPNERIGPQGWLSPEATNKMLTYGKKTGFNYDCEINDMSDIFQLGKLFWYIFQGNLPVGQIVGTDHNFKEIDIYNILFSMLQYQKQRRPNMTKLENDLKPLLVRYAV